MRVVAVVVGRRRCLETSGVLLCVLVATYMNTQYPCVNSKPCTHLGCGCDCSVVITCAIGWVIMEKEDCGFHHHHI